jgi:ATP-dependent Clp protease adaptor protein ClpS
METQLLDLPEVETKVPTGTHKLILHNDDFNTLDWVMGCLRDVCKHSPTQAEQCMVRSKGK